MTSPWRVDRLDDTGGSGYAILFTNSTGALIEVTSAVATSGKYERRVNSTRSLVVRRRALP